MSDSHSATHTPVENSQLSEAERQDQAADLKVTLLVFTALVAIACGHDLGLVTAVLVLGQ